ncbi:hypothetical protein [Dyella amyloliquefaciens]|nr:hypothetical protein [Dyella amyloliquefaciens]
MRLTVSRVSDGAIEVAVSTPERLKVRQPAERGGRAKPAAAARVKKLGGK